MPQGATGSNNIEEDPLFLDPANLDFRLAETSPCIDTAIALFVLNGDTLVNLNPNQYSGSAPDMGAFEYIIPFASFDSDSQGWGFYDYPDISYGGILLPCRQGTFPGRR